jgi:hypothetical protein
MPSLPRDHLVQRCFDRHQVDSGRPLGRPTRDRRLDQAAHIGPRRDQHTRVAGRTRPRQHVGVDVVPVLEVLVITPRLMQSVIRLPAGRAATVRAIANAAESMSIAWLHASYIEVLPVLEVTDARMPVEFVLDQVHA